MKDSTLKKLAHQLDGVGDPSPDSTVAARTAGLPTPDEAAVKKARLRQGLLVLTVSHTAGGLRSLCCSLTMLCSAVHQAGT